MTNIDSYIKYAETTLSQYKSINEDKKYSLVNELHDVEIERVLDVGCGAGLSLLPFAKAKNADCFGIDIGDEIGTVCKMVFSQEGVEKQGFFTRGVGEQLPFADESFDVLICRVALPYMDNRKAVSEFSRVLKPNGKIFLKIHAPKFYFWMLKNRLKTLNPKQLAYPLICLAGGSINVLTGQHPKGNFWKGKEVFQSKRYLSNLLKINGLEIVKELDDTSPETPSYLIEKTK